MRTIFAFVALFFTLLAQAQDQPFTGTNNKKASKLFGEALQAYTQFDGKKAVELLNKCTELDPQFVDAYMLLADIREGNEQFAEAIALYEKVIGLKPEFQIPYYKLAISQLSNGEYA